MANTKSSKKDLRRSAKRTAQNSMVRVSLKTYVKKSRKATAAGAPEAIATTLAEAVKKLDKAAQNGVIHPNQAARRKSRIAKQAAAALKAAGK
jgi:small subunit ribosomal protein S20